MVKRTTRYHQASFAGKHYLIMAGGMRGGDAERRTEQRRASSLSELRAAPLDKRTAQNGPTRHISAQTAKKIHPPLQRITLPVGQTVPHVQTQTKATRRHIEVDGARTRIRSERYPRTCLEEDRELASVHSPRAQAYSRQQSDR